MTRKHWGPWLAIAWLAACGPSLGGDDADDGDGDEATTDGEATTSAGNGAGDVDPGAPQGDGDTPTPRPDDQPVDSCCAADSDDRECAPETMVAQCDGELLCPPVTVECPREGGDLYDCASDFEYDEAALTCALESLAKRTPGRLEIDGTVDYGIFSGQDRYMLWIRGDDTVVTAGCLRHDAGAEHFGPDQETLADAAYFTACLDQTDLAQRYACLWAGLSDDQPLRQCQ